MPERVLAAAAFLITLSAITVLSLLPPGGAGVGRVLPPLATNLFHLPAYAALGFVSAWLLCGSARRSRHHPLSALALAVGIGVAIEWLQPLVGRSAEFGDVALNALGALLGVFAWRLARYCLSEELA